MEMTLQTQSQSVKLTIKLKSIGILICEVSQWLFAKDTLKSHGLVGVQQQTQFGDILRLTKQKKIPDDLVLGDRYRIGDIEVRDVYHRQLVPKSKRNSPKQVSDEQPSDDEVQPLQ